MRRWVWPVIIVFALIQVPLFTSYMPVSWDGAVYIGMGKHFLSQAKIGLYEPIRPPLLPLVAGLFWWLGLDPIIAGNLFILFCACGTLFLTYHIGARVYGKSTGLLAALFLAITPVFFEYSTRFMTGIPSTFFALLALIMFMDRRFTLTGFFTALAILTRFTQGIVLVTMFLFLASEYLGRQREGFLRDCRQGLYGFLPPLLAYLALNAYMTGSPFQPLLEAWAHGGYAAYAVDPLHSLVYYFWEVFMLNILLVFMLYYFYHVFRDERQVTLYEAMLAWIFLLSFVFFTSITNKQIRFVLTFLPYYALIAAQGFVWFARHYHYARWVIGALLLVALSQMLYWDYQAYDRVTEPPTIVEYTQYFADKNVSGPILVAHPAPAAFVDVRFEPLYGDLHAALRKVRGGGAVMYQEAFDCDRTQDPVCYNLRRKLFDYLMANRTMIFNKTFYGAQHYIFT